MAKEMTPTASKVAAVRGTAAAAAVKARRDEEAVLEVAVASELWCFSRRRFSEVDRALWHLARLNGSILVPVADRSATRLEDRFVASGPTPEDEGVRVLAARTLAPSSAQARGGSEEGEQQRLQMRSMQVDAKTRVAFLSEKYHFVFSLDLTQSLFVVDPSFKGFSTGTYLVDSFAPCMKDVLKALLSEVTVLGEPIVPLIYVTVLAQLASPTAARTLLRSRLVTMDSLEEVLSELLSAFSKACDDQARCLREKWLRDGEASEGGKDGKEAKTLPSKPMEKENQREREKEKEEEGDLGTMLRAALLALSLSAVPEATPAIVYFTDGVISADTVQGGGCVLSHLSALDCPMHVVQIGGGFAPWSSLGMVSDPDVVRFVASSTPGGTFFQDHHVAEILEASGRSLPTTSPISANALQRRWLCRTSALSGRETENTIDSSFLSSLGGGSGADERQLQAQSYIRHLTRLGCKRPKIVELDGLDTAARGAGLQFFGRPRPTGRSMDSGAASPLRVASYASMSTLLSLQGLDDGELPMPMQELHKYASDNFASDTALNEKEYKLQGVPLAQLLALRLKEGFWLESATSVASPPDPDLPSAGSRVEVRLSLTWQLLFHVQYTASISSTQEVSVVISSRSPSRDEERGAGKGVAKDEERGASKGVAKDQELEDFRCFLSSIPAVDKRLNRLVRAVSVSTRRCTELGQTLSDLSSDTLHRWFTVHRFEYAASSARAWQDAHERVAAWASVTPIAGCRYARLLSWATPGEHDGFARALPQEFWCKCCAPDGIPLLRLPAAALIRPAGASAAAFVETRCCGALPPEELPMRPLCVVEVQRIRETNYASVLVAMHGLCPHAEHAVLRALDTHVFELGGRSAGLGTAPEEATAAVATSASVGVSGAPLPLARTDAPLRPGLPDRPGVLRAIVDAIGETTAAAAAATTGKPRDRKNLRFAPPYGVTAGAAAPSRTWHGAPGAPGIQRRPMAGRNGENEDAIPPCNALDGLGAQGGSYFTFVPDRRLLREGLASWTTKWPFPNQRNAESGFRIIRNFRVMEGWQCIQKTPRDYCFVKEVPLLPERERACMGPDDGILVRSCSRTSHFSSGVDVSQQAVFGHAHATSNHLSDQGTIAQPPIARNIHDDLVRADGGSLGTRAQVARGAEAAEQAQSEHDASSKPTSFVLSFGSGSATLQLKKASTDSSSMDPEQLAQIDAMPRALAERRATSATSFASDVLSEHALGDARRSSGSFCTSNFCTLYLHVSLDSQKVDKKGLPKDSQKEHAVSVSMWLDGTHGFFQPNLLRRHACEVVGPLGAGTLEGEKELNLEWTPCTVMSIRAASTPLQPLNPGRVEVLLFDAPDSVCSRFECGDTDSKSLVLESPTHISAVSLRVAGGPVAFKGLWAELLTLPPSERDLATPSDAAAAVAADGERSPTASSAGAPDDVAVPPQELSERVFSEIWARDELAVSALAFVSDVQKRYDIKEELVSGPLVAPFGSRTASAPGRIADVVAKLSGESGQPPAEREQRENLLGIVLSLQRRSCITLPHARVARCQPEMFLRLLGRCMQSHVAVRGGASDYAEGHYFLSFHRDGPVAERTGDDALQFTLIRVPFEAEARDAHGDQEVIVEIADGDLDRLRPPASKDPAVSDLLAPNVLTSTAQMEEGPVDLASMSKRSRDISEKIRNAHKRSIAMGVCGWYRSQVRRRAGRADDPEPAVEEVSRTPSEVEVKVALDACGKGATAKLALSDLSTAAASAAVDTVRVLGEWLGQQLSAIMEKRGFALMQYAPDDPVVGLNIADFPLLYCFVGQGEALDTVCFLELKVTCLKKIVGTPANATGVKRQSSYPTFGSISALSEAPEAEPSEQDLFLAASELQPMPLLTAWFLALLRSPDAEDLCITMYHLPPDAYRAPKASEEGGDKLLPFQKLRDRALRWDRDFMRTFCDDVPEAASRAIDVSEELAAAMDLAHADLLRFADYTLPASVLAVQRLFGRLQDTPLPEGIQRPFVHSSRMLLPVVRYENNKANARDELIAQLERLDQPTTSADAGVRSGDADDALQKLHLHKVSGASSGATLFVWLDPQAAGPGEFQGDGQADESTVEDPQPSVLRTESARTSRSNIEAWSAPRRRPPFWALISVAEDRAPDEPAFPVTMQLLFSPSTCLVKGDHGTGESAFSVDPECYFENCRAALLRDAVRVTRKLLLLQVETEWVLSELLHPTLREDGRSTAEMDCMTAKAFAEAWRKKTRELSKEDDAPADGNASFAAPDGTESESTVPLDVKAALLRGRAATTFAASVVGAAPSAASVSGGGNVASLPLRRASNLSANLTERGVGSKVRNMERESDVGDDRSKCGGETQDDTEPQPLAPDVVRLGELFGSPEKLDCELQGSLKVEIDPFILNEKVIIQLMGVHGETKASIFATGCVRTRLKKTCWSSWFSGPRKYFIKPCYELGPSGVVTPTSAGIETPEVFLRLDFFGLDRLPDDERSQLQEQLQDWMEKLAIGKLQIDRHPKRQLKPGMLQFLRTPTSRSSCFMLSIPSVRWCSMPVYAHFVRRALYGLCDVVEEPPPLEGCSSNTACCFVYYTRIKKEEPRKGGAPAPDWATVSTKVKRFQELIGDGVAFVKVYFIEPNTGKAWTSFSEDSVAADGAPDAGCLGDFNVTPHRRVSRDKVMLQRSEDGNFEGLDIAALNSPSRRPAPLSPVRRSGQPVTFAHEGIASAPGEALGFLLVDVWCRQTKVEKLMSELEIAIDQALHEYAFQIGLRDQSPQRLRSASQEPVRQRSDQPSMMRSITNSSGGTTASPPAEPALSVPAPAPERPSPAAELPSTTSPAEERRTVQPAPELLQSLKSFQEGCERVLDNMVDQHLSSLSTYRRHVGPEPLSGDAAGSGGFFPPWVFVDLVKALHGKLEEVGGPTSAAAVVTLHLSTARMLRISSAGSPVTWRAPIWSEANSDVDFDAVEHEDTGAQDTGGSAAAGQAGDAGAPGKEPPIRTEDVIGLRWFDLEKPERHAEFAEVCPAMTACADALTGTEKLATALRREPDRGPRFTLMWGPAMVPWLERLSGKQVDTSRPVPAPSPEEDSADKAKRDKDNKDIMAGAAVLKPLNEEAWREEHQQLVKRGLAQPFLLVTIDATGVHLRGSLMDAQTMDRFESFVKQEIMWLSARVRLMRNMCATELQSYSTDDKYLKPSLTDLKNNFAVERRRADGPWLTVWPSEDRSTSADGGEDMAVPFGSYEVFGLPPEVATILVKCRTAFGEIDMDDASKMRVVERSTCNYEPLYGDDAENIVEVDKCELATALIGEPLMTNAISEAHGLSEASSADQLSIIGEEWLHKAEVMMRLSSLKQKIQSVLDDWEKQDVVLLPWAREAFATATAVSAEKLRELLKLSDDLRKRVPPESLAMLQDVEAFQAEALLLHLVRFDFVVPLEKEMYLNMGIVARRPVLDQEVGPQEKGNAAAAAVAAVDSSPSSPPGKGPGKSGGQEALPESAAWSVSVQIVKDPKKVKPLVTSVASPLVVRQRLLSALVSLLSRPRSRVPSKVTTEDFSTGWQLVFCAENPAPWHPVGDVAIETVRPPQSLLLYRSSHGATASKNALMMEISCNDKDAARVNIYGRSSDNKQGAAAKEALEAVRDFCFDFQLRSIVEQKQLGTDAMLFSGTIPLAQQRPERARNFLVEGKVPGQKCLDAFEEQTGSRRDLSMEKVFNLIKEVGARYEIDSTSIPTRSVFALSASDHDFVGVLRERVREGDFCPPALLRVFDSDPALGSTARRRAPSAYGIHCVLFIRVDVDDAELGYAVGAADFAWYTPPLTADEESLAEHKRRREDIEAVLLSSAEAGLIAFARLSIAFFLIMESFSKAAQHPQKTIAQDIQHLLDACSGHVDLLRAPLIQNRFDKFVDFRPLLKLQLTEHLKGVLQGKGCFEITGALRGGRQKHHFFFILALGHSSPLKDVNERRYALFHVAWSAEKPDRLEELWLHTSHQVSSAAFGRIEPSPTLAPRTPTTSAVKQQGSKTGAKAVPQGSSHVFSKEADEWWPDGDHKDSLVSVKNQAELDLTSSELELVQRFAGAIAVAAWWPTTSSATSATPTASSSQLPVCAPSISESFATSASTPSATGPPTSSLRGNRPTAVEQVEAARRRR